MPRLPAASLVTKAWIAFPVCKLCRSEKQSFPRPHSTSTSILRGKALKLSSFRLAPTDQGRICTTKAAMANREKTFESGPAEGTTLFEFAGMAELSNSLAHRLAYFSKKAISERGHFSVVLSGGSLVKALGSLAGEPHLSSLDWSKWHVCWADERVVPLTDPDSNFKAAKDEFLSKVPIPDSQVHTLKEGLPADKAAEAYQDNIRQLAGTVIPLFSLEGREYPRFDMVLLGMGPDGHVASLFPNHPLLNEKHLWVAPIFDSPKPPPQRITLTLPVLLSAAKVMVVAAGAGKQDMLQRILEEPAPANSLPAQMVRPQAGTISWLVDTPATAKLSQDGWTGSEQYCKESAL